MTFNYYPTVTVLNFEFPRTETGAAVEIRFSDQSNMFTLYSGDKGGTLPIATSKSPEDLKAYAFDQGAQSVRLSFDLRMLRTS